MKLDDEVREIAPGDALRVAPSVWRAWESGPDGVEILAFGALRPADGEVTSSFWT